jgi:membrane-associated phospholipid phosphatase
LMGATALGTSVIATATKFVAGRARPYTELGNHSFKPFHGREDFASFPSGHAVAAFSLSAVLAERIRNPWASIGLYGIAGLCSISRVYSRDHWVSDVFFSGALATLTARSIVHWDENEQKPATPPQGFQIVPGLSGIAVVWRF